MYKTFQLHNLQGHHWLSQKIQIIPHSYGLSVLNTKSTDIQFDSEQEKSVH